jgi:hypothetical protein
MRLVSLALAVAALVTVPVIASADQQSTGTQSEFKQSVKARHHTYKRHQIIRAESGKHTTGAAPR